jgi:hypothetical protein
MLELPQVTLIGVDCVDAGRLLHAADICRRAIRFGDVRILTSIPREHPDVVPIEPIASREAYSSFLVKRINRYVDTPFALIIQYDGFVLNPDAWSEEFLNYDYIGAPWFEPELGGALVGNGGFSLRSKRLLEILQQDDSIADPTDLDPPDAPEDWYICVMIREYLEGKGIRFAPAELAQRFSLEGGEPFGVTWTDQFGFHGLRWTDISPWLARHPEDARRIDNTLDEETRALKARLRT